MDKLLLVKILGKKNAFALDEGIYNLMDITEKLRQSIVLGSDIDEKTSLDYIKDLEASYNILKPVKDYIDDPNNIVGLTNSKVYLAKFLKGLCENIIGVMDSLKVSNMKTMIYHANILMDLILTYN